MLRRREMKERPKRILAIVLFAVAITFHNVEPIYAVDGRDFAGFYQSTNVVDQGSVVSLKFSTRIFNYSDMEVIGAYVSLDDALRLAIYAAFQNVHIDHGGQVILTADITVPVLEYQSWERGARPNLSIMYQDSFGNVFTKLVELVRMPL
jgi:hypothetical protein